jgi:hypothetical protein
MDKTAPAAAMEKTPPPATETAEPPAPEAVETEEDRLHEAQRLQRWRRVGRGFRFHHGRLIVVLACLLLALTITSLTEFLPHSAIQILEYVLAVGILIVAPLLGMLGSFLCLWAPKDTGARPLIMVSYFFDLVALPLGICYLANQFNSSEERTYARLGGVAVEMISWVMFIFYLRRFALFFDQLSAADEALQIVLWGIALVLTPWLLLGVILQVINLVPVLGRLSLPGLAVLALVVVVLSVLVIMHQLTLIRRLRRVILGKS